MALTLDQRVGRKSFAVEAQPQAVRDVRHRVLEAATPFVDPDRHGDLRLVISEVVSNAVRHGSPGDVIEVAVTPKEDYLCVQVTDCGAGLAPRPRAIVPDEHGGWGLFLIEQLTRRWGMTRENRQTRVWFELDFQAAA